ncbi:MAG: hypothetical protein K9M49_06790 [Candidatus Marinimicrobia bacterium]|nr:hypothetical protein [Candidatus Neomarinimicrobiota bacterium]MCF7850094.1 hypothetical protein [Candidatus Neomarinimicrobiota bacterium]MCF7904845.1 hypothetical protein [Candidatus Neomarinimicrobiota bacterium]
MDRLEKMVGEDQARMHPESSLDVDAVLRGTNKRIRFRRNRRRVIYSSPAVMLVALLFYFTIPTSDAEYLSPGDEWLMAGVYSSSSIILDEDMLEASDLELYDASIEYVTDLDIRTNGEELDELFSAEDMEAFYSYLKEA